MAPHPKIYEICIFNNKHSNSMIINRVRVRVRARFWFRVRVVVRVGCGCHKELFPT